jgi:hypothetical protein
MVMSAQLTSFPTGGHTIYQLKPATVIGKQRSINCAAFDGSVMSYTRDGKLIWENDTNIDFPFDLAVADIDGDGLDETFIATAAGKVEAFKSDGTKLWAFTTNGPLYQVCPIKTASGKWVILTGGIDERVISLSSKGQQIASIKVGAVVRHIRKGNIFGDGKEYAAIATATSSLNAKKLTLMLLNPENMEELWRKTDLSNALRKKFFSMIIMDINGDKKEDIVLSGGWEEGEQIYGFDYKGERILLSSNNKIPRIPYRMNLLTRINPSDENESIIGLFANNLIIYNGQGEYQSFLTSRYDFTNATFDPQTSTYYLGSCASGGDGIYAFDVKNINWKNAFENIKVIGKTAEIENNMATMADQIKKFKLPNYQAPPANINIIANTSKNAEYDKLTFATNITLTEKYGDRTELWCKVLDNRFPYNMTSNEIIDFVKEKEAKGENFVLWAWHGDAVYMRPSTMEKIIQIAPKHFLGFVCAELEQTDSVMQELILKILYPLAEQCLKASKKIIFRSKDIYWNGVCYMPFLKDVLLNPKFSKVFVPGTEETNDRTQEMSLAGRVGLWETGHFDRWACRVVTDNPTFDRFFEWSSQQIMSHYIRNMVLNAAMGSDYFFIDIHQNTNENLWKQLKPFYELINKGVIFIPKREDLLSVSSLCLGMKTPPSDEYLRHGMNGHRFNFDEEKPVTMVFNRLDSYWGAAPTTDYDFSNYGYGVERRMLNFLPKYPYGLVTIVPDEIDMKKFPLFHDKVTTDGQYFYDIAGKRYEAADYKQTMLEKLKSASEKLPVLVKGDAAWSVVRIDPNHVRVVLVDPGYTNPADRDVVIVLQHLRGVSCTDILSGEKLIISDQAIKVHIPAGVFRVLDVEYKKNEMDSET